jgi:2-methylcitrate dehydratase
MAKTSEEPKKIVASESSGGLNRRDLMKFGIYTGAAVASNGIGVASAAQQNQSPYAASAKQFVPMSRWKGVTGRTATAGYVNDSGRAYGNGPMDETSRRIVEWVSGASESLLTDEVVHDMGWMLVDTIGCAIAGFESNSIRIGAKVARIYPAGPLKSTVWGYDISTPPDLAGFVNGSMVRHNDFNDNGAHASDIVPGILAVAEALHSTGRQALLAMIISWEVYGALQLAAPNYPKNGIDNLYVGPACAMAVGKLMGLSNDQLANALSLSLVPHLPMRIDHAYGPNSMSKGNHDAEMVRCAIFGAICAREGMTGPAQPFEGMGGLWDVVTGPFDLKIPSHAGGNPMHKLDDSDHRLVVQALEYKRFPGNGGAPIMSLMPDFQNFAKPEDIESVLIEVNSFGDGSDPGKFDPRNEETADHSTPYYIAWALVHGDLFLDAYTKESLMNPEVRALMKKITIHEDPTLHGFKLTVRRKDGQEMTRTASEGGQDVGGRPTPIDTEELKKKFDRICAYKGITTEHRERIRKTWYDLGAIKDTAEAIHTTLVHFGAFKPL